MSSTLGTISRGIKAPIIKQGDNLAQIVCNCVMNAAEENNIVFNNRDVIAVTEAVVARAQGNYASIKDISEDVSNIFPQGEIGIIFPIMSRNRFSICLKGIALGVKKIYLQLSYPSDEVGNGLITSEQLEKSDVNPYKDVLTESKFREIFGYEKHIFTGVDYIETYKQLINEQNCECEVIFANNPTAILDYTKQVLCADIHTRNLSKQRLLNAGAEKVCTLDDILNKSVNNSGYNEKYGLLGSNKSTEESIKLFPRNSQEFVAEVSAMMLEKTGKQIEVMVYGDGAFKDPVGFIWELADPVVSPGYTAGLEGTPNELKLKYLADNDFAELRGEELKKAILNKILQKNESLVGDMSSQGTTPRRITDLLGSLSDLTSGSGDKGTPIVFIQNYFDNYATE